MRNLNQLGPTITKSLALSLAVGCVFGATALHAQPFGGGGFGATTPQRSTSTRTDNYPSSTDIGQARITYDQETRSIIVVADDETAMHITNVLHQLDRPT